MARAETITLQLRDQHLEILIVCYSVELYKNTKIYSLNVKQFLEFNIITKMHLSEEVIRFPHSSKITNGALIKFAPARKGTWFARAPKDHVADFYRNQRHQTVQKAV